MTTKTATPKLETDRPARVLAAKAEFTAWKKWNDNGQTGAEPETPNLTSIRNEETMTTKTATKTVKEPKAPKVHVRFYSNGHPLQDHSNTLAHVAVRTTQGCAKDGGKLVSSELKALLVKAGVTEIRSTWAVELPNGKMIGAVVDGDKVPAELVVTKHRAVSVDDNIDGKRTERVTKAAAKTPAKKAPAKKVAAKKAPARKTKVAA